MRLRYALPLLCCLLACLLAAAPALQCQEFSAWIPSTDRTDNPLIRELLSSGSLGERLAVAEALGARGDAYIGDLLESLLAGLSGPARPEGELLLRVMLASVFPPSLSAEELERRLGPNRQAIELLAESVPGFGAPLARETCRVLARAIGTGGGGGLKGALMAEGRRLAEALGERSGYSDSEEADRLAAFLEAVETIADPVFADIVVRILETTRTRELGRYARFVLARILPGAEQPPPESSR